MAKRWNGFQFSPVETMPLIFHITTRNYWVEAQKTGLYSSGTLATAGFIHCSRPHQVIDVANRLFHSHGDLVVLHIDTDRLDADLRYENLEGGNESFPHIYDHLPVKAVVGVSPIDPSSSGTFDQYRNFFEGSES